MNAFFEFTSGSPWLTLFLAWMIMQTIIIVWNRFWRHWNIRKHGYPPTHCDADGDFRKNEDG